ncbi:hypothetical protein [Olsenella phocaeensis]|uniref:hypothetical protein n=1 Tax=Olsenella phocaeensis TaxID=1852385 RepID=UPI000931A53E|nr:hypothetical protein [Olsenella phocaeensis]
MAGRGGHPGNNGNGDKDGSRLPNGQVPRDNESNIRFNMELFTLKVIDLKDPEAIAERYATYLGLCAEWNKRPTIEGMCFVMGFNRDELLRYRKGQRTVLRDRLSPEAELTLQKCLDSMAEMWSQAMNNNGYRNPVAGIFVGKNNFGYSDTSESVIRHETIQAAPDRKALAEKYGAALPEAVPAEDLVIEPPREKPKPKRKAPAKRKSAKRKPKPRG